VASTGLDAKSSYRHYLMLPTIRFHADQSPPDALYRRLKFKPPLTLRRTRFLWHIPYNQTLARVPGSTEIM